MIKALSDMGFKNVVFVADQLYELKKDKIQGRPVPALTGAVMFPIYHGNLPVSAKKTLGQKGNKDGCADCHADNSPFFTKLKVQGRGEIPQGQLPDPEGAHRGAADGGLGTDGSAGLGVEDRDQGLGYRVRKEGPGSRGQGIGYGKERVLHDCAKYSLMLGGSCLTACDPLVALAACGKPAEAPPPWKVIDASTLRAMMASDKGLPVYNTMSELECLDHRIPGTRCLACEDVENNPSVLPADKGP